MNSIVKIILVLSLGAILGGCASGVGVSTRHHHVRVGGSVG